ncbi:MAG: uracil-DNA glycosylase [Alphaproteobacteria bacterium]
MTRAEPLSECALCPRLVAFREQNQASFADWFNAPVPSFGDETARLAVVGLAPGLRGANRTGRPFTGDYAGHLLYSTLIKFGFAEGEYAERVDDGLKLKDCLITNAVRCVPPENKPLTAEIKSCRTYLAARLCAMPNLQAIVMLGRIAHDSTLHALKLKLAAHKFGHGAVHRPPDMPALFDSYHCSRYNTNTGALTTAMFEAVFSAVRSELR